MESRAEASRNGIASGSVAVWYGMRNVIASGSVAEWNRERKRRGMESRNGIASGMESTQNIIFSIFITSNYGERSEFQP